MDLAAPDYVRSIVSRIGPAEDAALPAAIAAASRQIRTWCNRELTFRAGIEELIAPELSARIMVREYPIVRLESVRSGLTTALTIGNDDPAARGARVELPTADPGTLVGDRVTLYVRRAGRIQPATVEFATLAEPTVRALGAAIVALGGGWRAEVAADLGDAGVDEILAGQGGIDASAADAELQVYADTLATRVDRAAGVITILPGAGGDPFDSMRFGPLFGLQEDDDAIGEAGPGLRVTYDGGYQVVPEDLQLACAELTKATIERMRTSSVLQSERTDTWSWTARQFGELVGGMPESVLQVIAKYGSRG